MKRSPALLFGILVLAAVAAFIFWPGDEDKDSLSPRTGDEGTRVEQKSELPVKDTPPAKTEEVEKITPTPLPEETEAAPPAAEKGRLVLVVREGSGEPVPHAEVFHVKPENVDPAALASFRGEDPVAFFRKHGERSVCNGEGQVRITGLLREHGLLAVHGDASGSFFRLPNPNGEKPEPIRIEISAADVVRYRLFTAQRKPCGDFPVGLIASYGFAVTKGRSKADGRGSLELTGMMKRQLGQAKEGLRLVPLVLTPEPLGQSFAIDEFPKKEIELTLPPHAWLRVKVIGPDGKPFEDAGMISVGLIEPSEISFGRTAPPTLVETPKKGEARFPLALGLSPRVTLQLPPQSPHKPVSRKIEGPKVEGEELVVELRMEGLRPAISGRLVDPKGEPLASRTFEGSLYEFGPSGGGGGGGDRIKTDAEGRFTFNLHRNGLQSGNTTRELRLVPSQVDPPVRQRAVIDLSREFPNGTTDIGDVILEDLPVLVSGIVVDGNDKPVSGAWVSVRHRIPSPWDPDTLSWEAIERFGNGGSTLCDAKGRFTLYGHAKSNELQLNASCQGFGSTTSETTVGTTDCRLALIKAGSFRCRIELGENESRKGLIIGIATQREGKQSGWGGSNLAENGEFLAENLNPGTYRFALGSMTLHELVHEIRDIQITPGATVDLGTIRVSHPVIETAFEVVDREGKAVQRVEVMALTEGRRVRNSERLRDDKLIAHHPSAKAFIVSAPGFLSQQVARSGPSIRVVLDRAPKVVLVIENPGDLPAAPFFVVPDNATLLGPKGEDSNYTASVPWQRKPTRNASGEHELPVCAIGRHLVRFDVGHEKNGMRTGGVRVEIEVKESPALQRIPVRLDPAQIKKAMETLQRN